MPDNDYRLVWMIHREVYAESGGASGMAQFPESAVPQHHLAGWALLSDEDLPGGGEPGPPPPVTPAELATLAGGTPPAADPPAGDPDPPPDGEGTKTGGSARSARTGRGSGQSGE